MFFVTASRPQSLPGADHISGPPSSLISATPDHQNREDFTVLAKDGKFFIIKIM